MPVLDLVHLDVPFSADEVEKVVTFMPLDKASGPDDFTGRFFRTCCNILKVDFMRAMGCFHQRICGACDQTTTR